MFVCSDTRSHHAVCHVSHPHFTHIYNAVWAGMVPLLLMGRWGTPMPYPSRMTVVFGKPIEVPRVQDPADDLVSAIVEGKMTKIWRKTARRVQPASCPFKLQLLQTCCHVTYKGCCTVCVLLLCTFCHCCCCCIACRAQVQKYLDQFISEMRAIFDKHKAAAGYSPDCKLVVL